MTNLIVNKYSTYPSTLTPDTLNFVEGSHPNGLDILVTNDDGSGAKSSRTETADQIANVTIKNGLMGYNAGSVPTNAKVILQVLDVDITFPIAAPNSVIQVTTAPTVEVVYDIVKEVSGAFGTPVTLGTITFPINSTTGTVSIATTTVVPEDDMLYILSPADTGGMKDLFIDLRGFSKIPFHV